MYERLFSLRINVILKVVTFNFPKKRDKIFFLILVNGTFLKIGNSG